VVNEQSGCLDLSERISKVPLQRNHFNMNKFTLPTEEDYLSVVDEVEKVVADVSALREKQKGSILKILILTDSFLVYRTGCQFINAST